MLPILLFDRYTVSEEDIWALREEISGREGENVAYYENFTALRAKNHAHVLESALRVHLMTKTWTIFAAETFAARGGVTSSERRVIERMALTAGSVLLTRDASRKCPVGPAVVWRRTESPRMALQKAEHALAGPPCARVGVGNWRLSRAVLLVSYEPTPEILPYCNFRLHTRRINAALHSFGIPEQSLYWVDVRQNLSPRLVQEMVQERAVFLLDSHAVVRQREFGIRGTALPSLKNTSSQAEVRACLAPLQEFLCDYAFNPRLSLDR